MQQPLKAIQVQLLYIHSFCTVVVEANDSPKALRFDAAIVSVVAFLIASLLECQIILHSWTQQTSASSDFSFIPTLFLQVKLFPFSSNDGRRRSSGVELELVHISQVRSRLALGHCCPCAFPAAAMHLHGRWNNFLAFVSYDWSSCAVLTGRPSLEDKLPQVPPQPKFTRHTIRLGIRHRQPKIMRA